MQYRVGKCGSCGATFRVAATFQGDKARCKSCADGVVEIGPVETAAAPATAASEESDELVEHVPSGRKGGGPSMKERLLAQRTEATPPAAPKPVPARKPAAAAKGAARPAGKPAQRPARGARPAPAAEASKSPRAEKGKRGAAAGEAPARSAARRSGAGSRRRGAKDEGEDDAPKGYQGRWKPKKKQSPLPFLGALAVVAAAVFGLWKFVLDRPAPAPTEDTVAAAEAPAAPAAGDADLEDSTTGEEDASADATAAGDEGADAEGTAGEEEASDEAPAAPPPADPSSVDLNALQPFEPTADTTPEEWAEIKRLVALVVDPEAGAAGNRARLELVDTYGKKAFPAIVNFMLKMDFGTDRGYRDGDVLQRTLMDIANGRNVGWKHSTEPEDVVFNKKAVKKLHDVWSRAKDDEAYWLFYSKQDETADEEQAGEEPELSAQDLDDLDDLDGLDGF